MLDRILDALAWRLAVRAERLRDAVAAESLPRFATEPRNLHIALPCTIANPERIVMGDDVWLGPGSRLIAMRSYPGIATRHPERPAPQQTFASRLQIGSRVTATAALQVTAHVEVTIEDDVLFASNVLVADGTHGFATPDEPYKYQPLGGLAPVRIGRGSWIGQNVVVMPGVTIGELAIVGANSVVTRSIPPRTIAVGAPARVVKRWDEVRRAWVSGTDADPDDSAGRAG